MQRLAHLLHGVGAIVENDEDGVQALAHDSSNLLLQSQDSTMSDPCVEVRPDGTEVQSLPANTMLQLQGSCAVGTRRTCGPI